MRQLAMACVALLVSACVGIRVPGLSLDSGSGSSPAAEASSTPSEPMKRAVECDHVTIPKEFPAPSSADERMMQKGEGWFLADDSTFELELGSCPAFGGKGQAPSRRDADGRRV